MYSNRMSPVKGHMANKPKYVTGLGDWEHKKPKSKKRNSSQSEAGRVYVKV